MKRVLVVLGVVAAVAIAVLAFLFKPFSKKHLEQDDSPLGI